MLPGPPQDHLATVATQDQLNRLACGDAEPVDERIVARGVIQYLAEDIYRVTDAVVGLGKTVHKLKEQVASLQKSQSVS